MGFVTVITLYKKWVSSMINRKADGTKKVMVSMELTLPVECPVPERWTLDQYSL